MLILLIIVIAAAFFFARHNPNSSVFASNTSGAEEALKKRFINGEIDEAAYKKMLEIIRN